MSDPTLLAHIVSAFFALRARITFPLQCIQGSSIKSWYEAWYLKLIWRKKTCYTGIVQIHSSPRQHIQTLILSSLVAPSPRLLIFRRLFLLRGLFVVVS